MDLLIIILVIIVVLFLFFGATQGPTPSATGVSSSSERRGKRVKVTLIHCWLFHDYPLRPFRYCSLHESCLLLTQAMTPLLERVPVQHYRDELEYKGLHPTITQVKGTTNWTLTITRGAILLTSHQLQVTQDMAHYWLLCQFYSAITKQRLTPALVIEEEPEEEEIVQIEEPVPVMLPEPVVAKREELDPTWPQAFYRAKTDELFSLDAKEDEEEEQSTPTLTELLNRKERDAFLTLLKEKLIKIHTVYQQEGKINQKLIMPGILKPTEWRPLLNREEGILWTQGIVSQNEQYETVMSKTLEESYTLIEAWSNTQSW